jgi:hypothetical protein
MSKRAPSRFSASELAGIEPTLARPGRAGYACLNLSATGGTHALWSRSMVWCQVRAMVELEYHDWWNLNIMTGHIENL